MRYNKARSKKIDYIALAEFRHEIRRFLNFSERTARAAGLEPQQHQALLALKRLSATGSSTVGDLARRMFLRHHSTVELADRLEKRGLIRRRPGALDRRQVILELTSRGNRALEKIVSRNQAELQTAGPLLIKALRAILRQAQRERGKRPPGQSKRAIIET